MTIKSNEIKSKFLFFSDTINLVPGKVITMGSEDISLLSKEQLGDLIEGFLLEHLEIGSETLTEIILQYCKYKYPELVAQNLSINNGLFTVLINQL